MGVTAVNIIAACGGELVTYLPAGSVARSFKAIVEWQPPPLQPGQVGVYAVNSLEIFIPKDSVDGVLEVQVRKDKVTFKRALSDDETTEFTVQKILREDAGITGTDGGMFHLLVQS